MDVYIHTNAGLTALDAGVELPPTVRSLCLRGNSISALAAVTATFPEAHLLRHLDLGANRLITLDASLARASGLEALLLDENFLSDRQLASALPTPLPYLLHLSLAGNALTNFALRDGFGSLRVLQLQRNQLVTLPKITNLPSLRVLIIDENVPGTAPGGVLGDVSSSSSSSSALGASYASEDRLRNAYLTHLRARECGLKTMSHFRSGVLPSLTDLDLDGNALDLLSGLDTAAPQLVHLSLRRNRVRLGGASGGGEGEGGLGASSISTLRSSLQASSLRSSTSGGLSASSPVSMPVLETLALDGNLVSDVAPLRGCRRLARLYLQHNLLRGWTPMPDGWGASLVVLDLSHNRVTDAGLTGLAQLSSLRALRLRGNKLTSPDALLALIARTNMPHLLEVDASGNPFTAPFYPGASELGAGAAGTGLGSTGTPDARSGLSCGPLFEPALDLPWVTDPRHRAAVAKGVPVVYALPPDPHAPLAEACGIATAGTTRATRTDLAGDYSAAAGPETETSLWSLCMSRPTLAQLDAAWAGPPLPAGALSASGVTDPSTRSALLAATSTSMSWRLHRTAYRFRAILDAAGSLLCLDGVRIDTAERAAARGEVVAPAPVPLPEEEEEEIEDAASRQDVSVVLDGAVPSTPGSAFYAPTASSTRKLAVSPRGSHPSPPGKPPAPPLNKTKGTTAAGTVKPPPLPATGWSFTTTAKGGSKAATTAAAAASGRRTGAVAPAAATTKQTAKAPTSAPASRSSSRRSSIVKPPAPVPAPAPAPPLKDVIGQLRRQKKAEASTEVVEPIVLAPSAPRRPEPAPSAAPGHFFPQVSIAVPSRGRPAPQHEEEPSTAAPTADEASVAAVPASSTSEAEAAGAVVLEATAQPRRAPGSRASSTARSTGGEAFEDQLRPNLRPEGDELAASLLFHPRKSLQAGRRITGLEPESPDTPPAPAPGPAAMSKQPAVALSFSPPRSSSTAAAVAAVYKRVLAETDGAAPASPAVAAPPPPPPPASARISKVEEYRRRRAAELQEMADAGVDVEALLSTTAGPEETTGRPGLVSPLKARQLAGSGAVAAMYPRSVTTAAFLAATAPSNYVTAGEGAAAPLPVATAPPAPPAAQRQRSASVASPAAEEEAEVEPEVDTEARNPEVVEVVQVPTTRRERVVSVASVQTSPVPPSQPQQKDKEKAAPAAASPAPAPAPPRSPAATGAARPAGISTSFSVSPPRSHHRRKADPELLAATATALPSADVSSLGASSSFSSSILTHTGRTPRSRSRTPGRSVTWGENRSHLLASSPGLPEPVAEALLHLEQEAARMQARGSPVALNAGAVASLAAAHSHHGQYYHHAEEAQGVAYTQPSYYQQEQAAYEHQQRQEQYYYEQQQLLQQQQQAAAEEEARRYQQYQQQQQVQAHDAHTWLSPPPAERSHSRSRLDALLLSGGARAATPAHEPVVRATTPGPAPAPASSMWLGEQAQQTNEQHEATGAVAHGAARETLATPAGARLGPGQSLLASPPPPSAPVAAATTPAGKRAASATRPQLGASLAWLAGSQPTQDVQPGRGDSARGPAVLDVEVDAGRGSVTVGGSALWQRSARPSVSAFDTARTSAAPRGQAYAAAVERSRRNSLTQLQQQQQATAAVVAAAAAAPAPAPPATPAPSTASAQPPASSLRFRDVNSAVSLAQAVAADLAGLNASVATTQTRVTDLDAEDGYYHQQQQGVAVPQHSPAAAYSESFSDAPRWDDVRPLAAHAPPLSSAAFSHHYPSTATAYTPTPIIPPPAMTPLRAAYAAELAARAAATSPSRARSPTVASALRTAATYAEKGSVIDTVKRGRSRSPRSAATNGGGWEGEQSRVMLTPAPPLPRSLLGPVTPGPAMLPPHELLSSPPPVVSRATSAGPKGHGPSALGAAGPTPFKILRQAEGGVAFTTGQEAKAPAPEPSPPAPGVTVTIAQDGSVTVQGPHGQEQGWGDATSFPSPPHSPGRTTTVRVLSPSRTSASASAPTAEDATWQPGASTASLSSAAPRGTVAGDVTWAGLSRAAPAPLPHTDAPAIEHIDPLIAQRVRLARRLNGGDAASAAASAFVNVTVAPDGSVTVRQSSQSAEAEAMDRGLGALMGRAGVVTLPRPGVGGADAPAQMPATWRPAPLGGTVTRAAAAAPVAAPAPVPPVLASPRPRSRAAAPASASAKKQAQTRRPRAASPSPQRAAAVAARQSEALNVALSRRGGFLSQEAALAAASATILSPTHGREGFTSPAHPTMTAEAVHRPSSPCEACVAAVEATTTGRARSTSRSRASDTRARSTGRTDLASCLRSYPPPPGVAPNPTPYVPGGGRAGASANRLLRDSQLLKAKTVTGVSFKTAGGQGATSAASALAASVNTLALDGTTRTLVAGAASLRPAHHSHSAMVTTETVVMPADPAPPGTGVAAYEVTATAVPDPAHPSHAKIVITVPPANPEGLPYATASRAAYHSAKAMHAATLRRSTDAALREAAAEDEATKLLLAEATHINETVGVEEAALAAQGRKSGGWGMPPAAPAAAAASSEEWVDLSQPHVAAPVAPSAATTGRRSSFAGSENRVNTMIRDIDAAIHRLRAGGARAAWTTSPRFLALSPFQRAVLFLCACVPAGRVTTYKAIADALGGSSQAVGNALSTNPFCPAPVPCHRVIKTTLTLGGFSGVSQAHTASPEITRKRALLAEEGVLFGDDLTLRDASRVWSDFTPEDLQAARQLRAGFSPAAVVAAASSGGSATSSSSSSSSSSSGMEALRARLANASGADVRAACRDGSLADHTSGLASGYAQANLVILPKEYAYDFLLFATRNPKPCPLLDVTDVGDWEAKATAPGSDIRVDLPKYRVFKHGVLVDEPCDITHLWPGPAPGPTAKKGKVEPHPDARTDWVAFLLGCSFSFEEALLEAGVPVRQLQEEKGTPVAAGDGARPPPADGSLAKDAKNVPMFRTCIPCAPAGVFSGPLVVSMRPMTPAQAEVAKEVTSNFPRVHGAPVYAGDAAALGISDICKPDFGDAVNVLPGEIPVFWACGVTPQAALMQAKVPIAITHAPGHMFVTDKLNKELAGFASIDVTPHLAK